ncbi:DUF6233 domain-containing protein [Streptomyces sp. NPDC091299]|uniref:DUF6233 domain-containing protein n=1 Tax=Streptomyces sp. NPDC091299 TaxID=3155302 RepID=UPI00342CA5E1
MSDLPPDPARLRAILAHLDRQLADNETVGIYLRIQRDTVRQALARADGQTPQPQQQRERPAVEAPPRQQVTRYVIEQRRTPDGPEEASVHLADCRLAGKLTHKVTAEQAMLALTDVQLTACAICRPDTELGVEA